MGDGCLSDDDVLKLLAGGLRSNADPGVELHLDACRRCRLLVSTLAAKTGDVYRAGAGSAFAAGETIAGRYQILALIGSGGMGEVYKVHDAVLGETVALKTLSAGSALDERGVARVKNEVQVARRVTHRNVCRVFDVGFHHDDGGGATIPFFTMELLAGETLRSRVRRAGPLAPGELRALVEQMASGLDAAHTAGVVHRDLKGENVMLVPEDGGTRVVITDFGLARPHADPTLRLLPAAARDGAGTGGRTGDVVAGTLGYMAPEQLSGGDAGPAADIYALGVVLYESLTGALPFDARGRAAGGAVPPLPADSRVPAAWATAIRRCLEAEPSARFQSARALVGALDRRGAGAGSRRWPPWSALAAALAITVALAVTAAAALRPRRESVAARPAPAGAGLALEPRTPPPLSAEPARPASVDAVPAQARAPRETAPPGRRPPARRAGEPRRSGTRAAASPAAPAGPVGKDDFINPFGSR
jgi:hypothetical protein